ncbi:DNRLRE domain-containing protein [Streptosporangium sp. V21-05]|uniref:DNRLRE domain-containing protein n=1 Tax=Streptosporangium sp. V21-05 TaxID=3446115 RepID=UPI003F530C77
MHRWTVLVAILTLPLSLMSAPAIAQDPLPATPATSPPSAPATPTGKAMAQAKKDNRRVEIESLHSESATYYANPDGKTLRMELSTQPIRVKNADGKGFTPIDTTLVEVDGAIKPKAAHGDLVLSTGQDKTLLRSRSADATAKISTPSALPEPRLKGNTATYPDAYGKGRDLVVTANPTGFRQQITIAERPVGPVSFRVPVELPSGLSFKKNTAGRPIIVGKDGKTLTEVRPTLLQDATAADASAPLDAGKIGRAAVTLAEDGKTLVFTPDAAFLADVATTYPVTMAAAASDWYESHTGVGAGMDVYINDVDLKEGWDTFSDPEVVVGKSYASSVAKRWRGYLKFPNIPAEFAGSKVDNADLHLWNHLSNTCGTTVGSGITARQVTSSWDDMLLSWNSQPSVIGTGADTEYGAYSDDCNYAWNLTHSLNAIVQSWVNGATNHGIQLTAGNESELRNWRRYASEEAGGCRTSPLEDCKFQPHPPILTVDFKTAPVEPLGAVGWFQEGDPGIESREDIERVNADPESVGATLVEPTALSITDDQAIEAYEQSEEVVEVPVEDVLKDDPNADEPAPEPEPDTTLPQVISTTPRGGATGVYTNSTIEITFSEGVTGAVLALTDPSGTAVAGTSVMREADSALVFTPTQALARSTTYSAQVTGAADSSGNAMAAPYRWSFATGDSAPVEHTITLPLESDLYITSDLNGSDQENVLWAGRYETDGDAWDEEAYLKFDATQIAGKTIKEANLRLWNNSTYGCGDATSSIKAQRLTANWSATTINWDNRPDATEEGQAFADDGAECEKYNAPWDWNTTEIVQAWAVGQFNRGLVLRGTDQSADAPLYDRGFHSSEASVESSRRPTLTVTYIGEDGPLPGDDTIPPSVLDVTPQDGAENAPLDTPISVRFSEPVAEATLTLTEAWFEGEVSGQTSFNADRTVLTFVPDEPLTGFYYVAALTGVEDNAGNAMPDYNWSWFSVEWSSTRAGVDSSSTQPKVENLRTRTPKTVTNSTPSYLMANVRGSRHRSLSVTFEAVQVSAPVAGARTPIWSATVKGVASGNIASVSIPTDKLAHAEAVQWRARATAGGIAGPWSEWERLATVRSSSKYGATANSAVSAYPPADDPPAPASSTFERLTPQKCAERKELAGRGIGWISNHFSWCQMGRVEAAVDQGMKFARYRADIMLIGYTFNGKGDRKKPGETSRDLVVEAYLYNHDVYDSTGTVNPSARTMVLNMSIGNYPRCENVTSWNGQAVSNQKSALIGSWVNNGRATFRFKCDPLKASNKRIIRWSKVNSEGNTREEVDNNDRVSYGTFRAWANFPNWPSTQYKYVMSNKDVQGFKGNTIRCDTASGTRYSTGGCIFHTTKAAIKWKYTASAKKRTLYMKQAYQHYWNACKDPAETYPNNPNKIIRGCDVLGSGDPAERRYIQKVFSTEADANHNQTGSFCASIWGGDYTEGGRDCDEYPFASTREQTRGRIDGDYSVCPILKTHNSDAGTALQEFYQKDRVIAGDYFTNRFGEAEDPQSREELCGEP